MTKQTYLITSKCCTGAVFPNVGFTRRFQGLGKCMVNFDKAKNNLID